MEPLPGKLSQFDKVNEIVSITGLRRVQVVQNVSGDNSGFLVNWVDLPLNVFNTGIPGAVFVNAQGQSGSSYNITTCTFNTFNAGRGSSTLLKTFGGGDAPFGRMSNVPSSGFLDVPVEGDISFYECTVLYEYFRFLISPTTYQRVQELDRISQPHCCTTQ